MKNKVAIVTGAGSGIGRSTSIELANAGATVIVSDINEYSAQKTCGLILEEGNNAIAMKADVTVQEDLSELVAFTVSDLGRVDIMINNAGIGGDLQFMEDYNDETYHEVIAVNLTGVWYGMKAVLPTMKQQGSGAIVNVSSVAGLTSASRMSAYAASKHGVVGLTKTAASEYSKFNILINAVCPSVIDTEMGRSYANDNQDILDMIKSSIPMKRFGEAEEVAKLIVWLCSDQNSFVTGQALAIDGGFTSR